MSEQLDDWLLLAEEDYRTATDLDPESTPRSVCFHSQQCIERYLKGALAIHGQDIPRIHNLVVLNDALVACERRFGSFVGRLELLNPHAVATRYQPAGISAEDAVEALDAMQSLRTEVRLLMGLDEPAPGAPPEPPADNPPEV